MDFWDMTYQEVLDDVIAYQENKLEDLRFKARLSYQNAELIAVGVGISMGSKAKFPKIYEVYPGLFDKPKEEEPKQQNSEIMKARLMQYAEFHNNKMKGGIS